MNFEGLYNCFFNLQVVIFCNVKVSKSMIIENRKKVKENSLKIYTWTDLRRINKSV